MDEYLRSNKTSKIKSGRKSVGIRVETKLIWSELYIYNTL